MTRSYPPIWVEAGAAAQVLGLSYRQTRRVRQRYARAGRIYKARLLDQAVPQIENRKP